MWVGLALEETLLPHYPLVSILWTRPAVLCSSHSEPSHAKLVLKLLGHKRALWKLKLLSVVWEEENIQTKVIWDCFFLSSRAVLFRNVLGLFTDLTLFHKYIQVYKALLLLYVISYPQSLPSPRLKTSKRDRALKITVNVKSLFCFSLNHKQNKIRRYLEDVWTFRNV